MIHAKTITVPANTVSTELYSVKWKIPTGIIYQIMVIIPTGHANLTGLRIMNGAFQVWPNEVGEFFHGNNLVINFNDLYDKSSSPLYLELLAYNTDTQYNHEFQVLLGIESKDVFLSRYVPSMTYELFIKSMEEQKDKANEIQMSELKNMLDTNNDVNKILTEEEET